MKLKFRKKPLIVITLTLMGLFLCINTVVDNFIINSSDSLPHYLYKRTHSLEGLNHDSIVLICADKKSTPMLYQLLKKYHPQLIDRYTVCKGEISPLIKKIGALPHDRVVASGDKEIIVNNKELKGTTAHQKLEAFKYTGEVPADRYLVYTPNPNSLDSRYFGFVTKKELMEILIPVF